MAQSDGIITFTAPKPVHVFGGLTKGPIAVADIGSPDELILESGQLNLQLSLAGDLGRVFAPRQQDANKGDFGHILVIGGSLGKAGAAAMAGMAALRSGAGLVTVACPRSVQPAVASFAPEIMTEPLPENEAGTLALASLKRIEQLLPGKDAVVIGPGLGRHAETDELVRKLSPKQKQKSCWMLTVSMRLQATPRSFAAKASWFLLPIRERCHALPVFPPRTFRMIVFALPGPLPKITAPSWFSKATGPSQLLQRRCLGQHVRQSGDGQRRLGRRSLRHRRRLPHTDATRFRDAPVPGFRKTNAGPDASPQ